MQRKIPVPDLKVAVPYETVYERGVMVPQVGDPEGKCVCLDLFRPDDPGQFPTVLMASSYRREFMQILPPTPQELTANGYAVVLMDVRGTGSSEGVWNALSTEEIDDVMLIVDEWIPSQSWSNGKVGMYGMSIMGIAQYLVAARHSPHLKAMLPGAAMGDAYRDIFYHGGILDQEFMLAWGFLTVTFSLLPSTELFRDPASAMEAFQDHVENIENFGTWLGATVDGPFYDSRSPLHYLEHSAAIPVFSTTGWWDLFTRGAFLNYTGLAEESRKLAEQGGVPGAKRFLAGPWYHIDHGTGIPMGTLQKRWLDWHLKLDEDPDYENYDIFDPQYPVCLYVYGEERWRKEKAWPLARAVYKTLYLSSERQVYDERETLNNGSLVWEEDLEESDAGPPAAAASVLTHDPEGGLQTFAGMASRANVRWFLGLPILNMNGEDDSRNETRTLTFTTAPLEEDVEVTGPMVLRLWARSSFGAPLETPPDVWYFAGGFGLFPVQEALVVASQQTRLHWVVNLNDVFPGGRSRNITSGWLAASHRPDPARPDWTQPGYDPLAYPEHRNPVPPEAGKLYEYVIEIWPGSNVFKAGHQIRIDVAHTDYPHLLPSLVPSETEILHDPEHPSRLVLPVVPLESTLPGQWIDDPDAFFTGETW